MHFKASTFMIPYLHQFSAVLHKIHFFGAVWLNYAFYLGLIKKIYAETAPFNGAIWDELISNMDSTIA